MHGPGDLLPLKLPVRRANRMLFSALDNDLREGREGRWTVPGGGEDGGSCWEERRVPGLLWEIGGRLTAGEEVWSSLLVGEWRWNSPGGEKRV